MVKILDRLAVAAMTINGYYAEAEEEQIVPEQIIAQCLATWMSVNHQEIPGFDPYADLIADRMVTHKLRGQVYNPVVNVMMLRGPAAGEEGMNSGPISPALQPGAPSVQETERDPNYK